MVENESQTEEAENQDPVSEEGSEELEAPSDDETDDSSSDSSEAEQKEGE